MKGQNSFLYIAAALFSIQNPTSLHTQHLLSCTTYIRRRGKVTPRCPVLSRTSTSQDFLKMRVDSFIGKESVCECPLSHNKDIQSLDGDKGKMKKRKKKKKKKKTETLFWLPEEVMLEFLLRLPVKNLNQWKCVSKHWCSVISSRSFLDAYVRRHRGGLVISIAETTTTDAEFAEKIQLRFYYSGLEVHRPEPFFCRLKLPVTCSYKGVTQVVNGLACVYEDERVLVCNVCTGEIMRLPEPLSMCRNYFFGYDSVDGIYKLLRLTRFPAVRATAAAHYRRAAATADDYLKEPNDHPRAAAAAAYHRRAAADFLRKAADYGLEAEILTLGRDSTWRKLAVPIGYTFIKFDTESLSINGVLYWVNKLLGPSAGLISFNLKQEKFQLVKPPQEDMSLLLKSPNLKLAQFRGCVALSCIVAEPECHFVLYVLEEDEGNLWSKHIIPLPPGFGGFASIGNIPVGNLPTGQLLLVNTRAKVLAEGSSSFTPVYAYDHEKDKFERFVIGKFPESMDLTGFKVSISCLVENSFRLGDLLGQGDVWPANTGYELEEDYVLEEMYLAFVIRIERADVFWACEFTLFGVCGFLRGNRETNLEGEELTDEAGSLNLKLVGQVYPVQKVMQKSGKEIKVMGSLSNLVVCQVEDCQADLSNAGDYHRRLKVWHAFYGYESFG
ncbi:hypothetical protein ACH5RR_007227 [Cinchona calisaya]|uniref:F-box domain-containing protein n=1 Tax=Cinchona calisaya TaxID=153742 RepID=A0ABD3ARK8_9GENT